MRGKGQAKTKDPLSQKEHQEDLSEAQKGQWH